MAYKVIISTDKYKCARYTEKTWERGTRNDYMLAINGWHTTERNLREVRWRLDVFQGMEFPHNEWDETKCDWSDRYTKWKNKRCNTIRYYDKMCGFERTHRPSGYGWMQGYFDRDKVIKELRTKGAVKIPFSYLYDIRQYDKDMDGCYMQITKI